MKVQKRWISLLTLIASVLVLAVGVALWRPSETYAIASQSAALTTDQTAVEDFSEYTNQELPSNYNFEEADIWDLIPKAALHAESKKVYHYSGSSYGFLTTFYAEAYHILIYTAECKPDGDKDGYESTLTVRLTRTYSRVYLPLETPFRLVLKNIVFQENVINHQGLTQLDRGYDQEQDQGAFFVHARTYGTSLTHKGDGMQEVNDTLIKLLYRAADKVLPIFGKAYSIAVDATKWVELLFDNVTVQSRGDSGKDFPLTKEGQLDPQSVTEGRLAKSMEVKAEDSQYRYGFQEKEEKCKLSAKVRVHDPNRIGYDIASLVTFEAELLSTFSESLSESLDFEGQSFHLFKLAGTVTQTSELFTSTIRLEDSRRTYNVAKSKGMSFKFQPNETAQYRFQTESGAKCYVKDKPFDYKYQLQADTIYEIAVIPQDYYEDIDWLKKSTGAMSLFDFASKTSQFERLEIVKEQALTEEFAPLTCVSRKYLQFNDWSNDVLEFSTQDGDLKDATLTLYDEQGQAVNHAVRVGNTLRVNYAFTPDTMYSAVVTSSESLVGRLRNLGALDPHDDTTFASASEGTAYYLKSLPYSNYYTFGGSVKSVKTLYGKEQQAVDGAYSLIANQRYFIESDLSGGSILPIIIPESYHRLAVKTQQYPDANAGTVFHFYPTFGAKYDFGTVCDVYASDGTKIASDTRLCALEQGQAYHLIVSQAGMLQLLFGSDADLAIGDSYGYSAGQTVLRVAQEQRERVAVSANATVTVFDADLNPIGQDHGYVLNQGIYYIVIDAQSAGNVTLADYLQPIDLRLSDTGERYDWSGTVYYDRDFTLPAPSKEGYDFDGWQDQKGVMYTDASGNGIRRILSDKPVELHAVYTARDVKLQVKVGEQSVIWWTGADFGANEPDQGIAGNLVEELVRLKDKFIAKDEGKKVGHFLFDFSVEKTASVTNVDYYVLTPIWMKERYYVVFTMGKKTYASKDPVSYGDPIDADTFPPQIRDTDVFGYLFLGWYGKGVYLFNNESTTIPDLTPHYGTAFDYDVSGDGIDDCTYVDAIERTQLREITIRIGKQVVKTNVEQGYRLQSLGSYTSDLAQYYGYNVRFRLSGSNLNFTEGEELILMQYETEVLIEKDPIRIQLSYDLDCDNPSVFYVTDPTVQLKGDNANIYKDWEGWLCRGKTVNQLSTALFDEFTTYHCVAVAQPIQVNMSAKYVWTESDLVTTGTQTLNASAVILNSRSGQSYGNITLVLTAQVRKITIRGNGAQWKDFAIRPSSAAHPLQLNLSKVDVTVKSQSGGLIDQSLTTDRLDLTIHSEDSNVIRGVCKESVTSRTIPNTINVERLTLSGNHLAIYGADSINADPYFAGFTVIAQNVTVTAREVFIYAGNGKRGNDGESNGYAGSNASGKTVVGGTGGRGDDGEAGGIGGVGLVCMNQLSVSLQSCVTIQGGNGGRGGNGRIGGQGGKGSNGINGSFGKTTVAPGVGGVGGRGGNGGAGGTAGMPCSVQSVQCYGSLVLIEGKPGDGGTGGNGGRGGQAGDAARKWPTNTIVTEHGGTGGAGGTGGKKGIFPDLSDVANNSGVTVRKSAVAYNGSNGTQGTVGLNSNV